MTTNGQIAIEVSDLRKTYRSGFFGRRRVDALCGVSLRVQKGEIFGLLGPNGAGKTTLIKVLLGIVRQTGGAAAMLSRPVGDRRCRRSVGYLPEAHRFPQHHTGNTALDYFGGLSGLSRREIRQKRPALLELVGLGKWGTMPVRKYSKGMQQRLGLAQAMLHDPDLLILDEPTDGVDPIGRKDMREILQQLQDQGKTVFINSHLLQEVELVCDRVAILDKGLVRRSGRIDELTQTSDNAVTLTLVGSEANVRKALATQPISTITPGANRHLTVTLALADQQAIDQCVDSLRGGGISIVALSSSRRSLEDAFLDIITGDDDDANDADGALDAEIIS